MIDRTEINLKEKKLSNIPAIPSLPFIKSITTIPLIPGLPLIKSGGIQKPLKKLKCLNLREINSKVDKKFSIWDDKDNLQIDPSSVEEFFKIREVSQVKKQSENDSKQISKVELVKISSFIDRNKFTAIHITIRKLNSMVNFNFFVDNMHCLFNFKEDDKECEKEIKFSPIDQKTLSELFIILSSAEVLNIMYTIIPSATEIKNISSEIFKSQIDEELNDAEKWLVKCCEFPEIKNVAESLINFFSYESRKIEIDQILDIHLLIYHHIINNKNVRIFLNLLLNVNNYLNRETGKKEISNFDVNMIESLSEMKINSKNFFTYLFSVYTSALEKLQFFDNIIDVMIIDKKEASLILSIMESHNSPLTLCNEIRKLEEEILSSLIMLKTILKEEIYNYSGYNNQFAKIEELTEKNSTSSLENKFKSEKCEREKFLTYFNYSISEDGAQVLTMQTILKNLFILGNKTQPMIQEYAIKFKSNLRNVENPESKHRKTTLNDKSKITMQNNNLSNSKNNQKKFSLNIMSNKYKF